MASVGARGEAKHTNQAEGRSLGIQPIGEEQQATRDTTAPPAVTQLCNSSLEK